MIRTQKRLLPLGTITATHAAEKLTGNKLGQLIRRHELGDWGQIGDLDWRTNDQAIIRGERIMSVYPLTNGTQVYVITEADRSATTVLLPEEY